MAKLFLPQATLEEWALSDKADVREGRLLVTEEKASFTVTPATHFQRLVSGTDDKKLVSKVKTQEQMAALGVEQMMDSALVGEAAYEVVPGYLTEVPIAAPRPAAKKASPEADMLAAFILDKLS